MLAYKIYPVFFHRGISTQPPKNGYLLDALNVRFDTQNVLKTRPKIDALFSTAPASGHSVKAFYAHCGRWYAVSNGYLYRSSDQGNSWSSVIAVNNTYHSNYMFTHWRDIVLLVDGTKYIKYDDGSSHGTITVPDSFYVNKIVAHQNRIYVARTSQWKVYYTAPNTYDNFSDGGMFEGDTLAGPIQTLANWRGHLLIITTNNIAELYGDPDSNPTLVSVLDMGTDQHRSAVVTPDALYFSGSRGIIEWSGANTYSIISSAIRDEHINAGCWGAYEPKTDSVLFSTTNNNNIWVYDRRLNIWYRDNTGGAAQIRFAPARETENNLVLLSDNEIPQYYDTGNVEDSCTVIIQTKRIDCELPGVLKRLAGVSIYGAFDEDCTVKVLYAGLESSYSNYTSMHEVTLGTINRPYTFYNTADIIAAEFSIKLETSNKCALKSLQLLYEPIRPQYDYTTP